MRRWLSALALAAAIGPAAAHTFAAPYTLPVPFWMYAWGATAALVLSFAVVAVFSRSPVADDLTRTVAPTHDAASEPWPRSTGWRIGQALSVALLALAVATGLFGTPNPFANFNMTFFWIVFVLGVPYLTALVGDFYRFVNPWRALCEALARLWPAALPHAAPHGRTLAFGPATVLYMAFIWLELFGHTTPKSLAWALLTYTSIQFVGARIWGIDAWFRRGEFFAVFLRLIGQMAPRAHSVAADGTVTGRWRKPFVGLLDAKPAHAGLTVFVLFMLSGTAFDGLHESAPWSLLFWRHLYPLIEPLVQLAAPQQPYGLAARVFNWWQWGALVASPFVYLAFYLGALKLTQRLSEGTLSLRETGLAFATSLVPIAFVYHLTHYYTVLLSQGAAIVKLVSDPFGWGWNLFGTAKMGGPIFLDANTIWHTQVGFILLGHVVSVFLAHVVALRVFRSNRRAWVSQLPMLLLMVGLTGAGLWILSLPLASGAPLG